MMKSLRLAILAMLLFIGSGTMMAQVTIGNGTDEFQQVPIEPFYGYTYSQSIYLQSEINASDSITSISWYFSGTSTMDNTQDLVVYMGHTTKSAFTSTTDWIDTTSMTRVYTGVLGTPAGVGWIQITLDEPFLYNNMDNLVIAVDENTPSYNTSADDFHCTSVSGNRSIYYRNDNTNPDPGTPPTATGSVSFIPNVILGGLTQACLPPSMFAASNVSTTGATISWTSASGLSNVEYGPAGFTPGSGTALTGVTSPQNLTNLTGSTVYDVYIIDDCGSGNLSTSLQASFVTIPTASGITCTTPGASSVAIFTEEFDNNNAGWTGNVGSGNGNWEIPDNATSSNTGADNAHSGANYMNYEASTTSVNQGSIVSPAIDLSAAVNDAELSFWMHAYGSTMGTLEVGIGTSSAGPFTNVFTWSGQLQTTGSAPWQNVGIDLNSYMGQTIFLQFTQIDDQGGFTGDMSIDLVEVSACFTCVPPSAPSATVLSSTSAEVTWTAGLNETAWDIQYGPTGFLIGTGDSVTANNTTDTLTGLMPNTAYDYYVRANCGGTSGVSGWVGPASFTTPCAGPVAGGTYTIDANQAPSATNYTSFTALADAINPCGISGPIVVNVAAGTYNEHVTFEDVVGTSSTNTITINGGGATIEYDGSATQSSTMRLRGTDHMTIDNLTIVNTESSSSGWGIHLLQAADSNTISNCTVTIDQVSTSSSFAGIIATNSNTSTASYANNANNTTISNTTVNGGYYGVRFNGNTTAAGDNTNNTVENCTFNENRFYPMYFIRQDGPIARGNTTFLRSGVTSGYGIYMGSSKHPVVEGNYFNDARTYGIFYTSINTVAQNPTMRGVIANNMVTALASGDGIYLSGSDQIDVFHNSVTAENDQALWINSSSDDYDVRNNIFTITGSTYVVDLDAAPDNTTDVLNYNVYYNSGSGSIAQVASTNYTDLATWQAANTSQNMSSLEGDPLFVSATDLHVLGPLANDVGDNTVAITTDIDGDTRPAGGSTTVDIGADEFTPVTGDWGLLAGMIIESECYSTSDSLMFYVQNTIGGTADFSVTPLSLSWNVTGPVSSNGTITVNSGTLALGDTAIVFGTGANLSIPGNYTLNAYIDTNAANQSALNDTISPVGSTVNKLVTAAPTMSMVTSTTDTVELTAFSPIFPNGGFFMTEVCHFRTASSGAPAGGWPSYMLAGDYIEITGSPGSDLGGYTLEQWSTSALVSSYTFPPGTLLGPSGTAIIAVGEMGSSQPSPSDFYYHGNGGYSGAGSTSPIGRILKDPTNMIEDAVGYAGGSSYTFPAAANVSASDWSGNPPTSGSTAGIRLEGADVNSGTNWVASATSPQDPNQVNSMVTAPSAPPISGFTWMLDGNTIDTATTTLVGPWAANNNGTYKYVAAYNSPNCGLVYDTATVVVNIPCGVVTAPFFDGFEAGNTYTSCWSQVQITGTKDWTFATGSSGGSVTTANSGSVNARFTSSFGGPHVTHLITPVIDASALTATQLEFAYAQENWAGDQNFLNVYYRDSANGAWNLVFSDSTDQPAWTNTIVAIPSTSATLQIGFEGVDNYGRANVIDDVMVGETPSCPQPLALGGFATSTTTATVFWSSNAASFQIEYDTTGFMPGMGNMMIVSNDTATITGLMANTNYDYYVRAICGPADTSTWSGPASFFTGYCTPAPSTVDGQGITNVTMGGINNTTGAEPGNYGDYTNLVAVSSAGATMPIDITLQTGYTYDLWAWVDWNNDLDFLDSNEANYLGTSTSSNPTTYNGSLAIPANAAVGAYRIRIGGADAGLGTTPPSDPCYTGSWGAFEDYSLNIAVPLDSFDLLSPPDMATLLVAGPAQNQVVASWQSASANASYEWRAFLPGGSVNAPIVAITSDNGGTDTNLTLTIGQLDALLASLNVNIGDTATVEWSVKAMESGDSLFANMPFTLNLVRLGTSAPNVVAAPVGGTGTTGLSAPNGTTASFFRAATIVTAAEFSDANIANGSALRSMGFGLDVPAPGAVQGIMKVYLVNTTDAAYSKGNIWDTITSDMTLVFDDTVDIAAGASAYNMTFSNNFSYSGNNLYVAYDWEQLSTPITASLVYRANTVITSSIRRQASTVAPPATLSGTSSFRPELLWGIDKEADDLQLSALFAKGKNPLSYGAPETIQVLVRNNGYLTANKQVTLNISGANTLSTTATVNLASEADTLISFTFTAANTGVNTVTASVPSDDVAGNDSITWIQESTMNTFGYADTATVGLGAVGYNTGSGLLLSRYELTGTAAVTDVNLFIGDDADNVGNAVYAVVLDTAGNIVAQSANQVITATNLGTWVGFSIASPPTFTNEPFFVGLAQPANTTTGYFPLGFQSEDPTRADAYFTGALAGGTLSPIGGFRFMIEAVVDTPPSCPDPANLMAMAGCADASLSWDSDTSATSTIQWGPTGFTPGSGNFEFNASSPFSLTGLSLGTSYDFWVLDSCSAGSVSSWVGPITFTTDTLPVVSATYSVTNVTLTDADVDFNTTGTGSSYAWDFGDGNSGTGASPSHTYTANGTFQVVVTATNNCGTSTDTIQAVIEGIDIDEFGFGNIGLYPNPNNGSFTVTGITAFGDEATLEVINSMGQVMMSKTINASGQESVDVNIDGLAPGAYQLRVRNNKGVGVKSFVVRN